MHQSILWLVVVALLAPLGSNSFKVRERHTMWLKTNRDVLVVLLVLGKDIQEPEINARCQYLLSLPFLHDKWIARFYSMTDEKVYVELYAKNQDKAKEMATKHVKLWMMEHQWVSNRTVFLEKHDKSESFRFNVMREKQ
jgi:hypothetical protein